VIVFLLHYVSRKNILQAVKSNLSYDAITAYGKQMLVLFLDNYCI